MSAGSRIMRPLDLVRSHNDQGRLEGTRRLRHLLCNDGNNTNLMETLIQEDVIFYLVDFLQNRSSPPELQLEAAWILTNIASRKYIDELIRVRAIPTIVDLLHFFATTREHNTHEHDAVWQQAVWFVGNVAATSVQCRDDLLERGVLISLLRRFCFSLCRIDTSSMLHVVARTLSNFCKQTPKPLFKKIRPMLPILSQILKSDEEEVLHDASSALFVLSEGSNKKIQAVVDSGVCRRLVTLLKHDSAYVVIPVLSTVGNIVSGNEEHTQHIMNYDELLPNLSSLLDENLQTKTNIKSDEDVKSIRMEAYWTISNIIAGNKDRIKAVIDSKIIDRVLSSFSNADWDYEAIWVLTNVTSGGDHGQINYLVNKNCVKALCYMLRSRDANVVTACLEGLEDISKVGEVEKINGHTEDMNLHAERIEGVGGFDRIHSGVLSREVKARVEGIRHMYWSAKEDMPQFLFGNKYADWVIIVYVVLTFFPLLAWFFTH